MTEDGASHADDNRKHINDIIDELRNLRTAEFGDRISAYENFHHKDSGNEGRFREHAVDVFENGAYRAAYEQFKGLNKDMNDTLTKDDLTKVLETYVDAMIEGMYNSDVLKNRIKMMEESEGMTEDRIRMFKGELVRGYFVDKDNPQFQQGINILSQDFLNGITGSKLESLFLHLRQFKDLNINNYFGSIYNRATSGLFEDRDHPELVHHMENKIGGTYDIDKGHLAGAGVEDILGIYKAHLKGKVLDGVPGYKLKIRHADEGGH